MAKKQYISSVVNRTARPRSRRLRELGIGGAGGGTVVVGNTTGAATVETHTHDNKADLDKLSVDNDRYIHVTAPRETEAGAVEITKEKAKAGFADVAGDLTDDSAAWNKILRKDINDTAKIGRAHV